MNTHSPAYKIIVAGLRIALLLAFGAVLWNIYQKLPGDNPAAVNNGPQASATTALLILLEPMSDEMGAALDIPVELYPVDVAAVRREYLSEMRAGMRFDDFLAQRMNGRTPIKAQLDQTGRTTLMVPSGKWWIHATLTGTLNVEWRLPVNVAGRKQEVELTPENAYARTKSF